MSNVSFYGLFKDENHSVVWSQCTESAMNTRQSNGHLGCDTRPKQSSSTSLCGNYQIENGEQLCKVQ